MQAHARKCALHQPLHACVRGAMERDDAMGSLGTSCGTGRMALSLLCRGEMTSWHVRGRLGAGGELGRWMPPCGVVV